LLNLFHEAIEFFVSMEVVSEPQSAAAKVFTQVQNVLGLEDHLLGFDRVDDWILEYIGAGGIDKSWPSYIDSGQSTEQHR
jgi:hypothetical protein